MPEQPQRQLEVEFSVQGIPDSAGLRIKTTNPTGVYLSGKDREAAQRYFEEALLKFASQRRLLHVLPNEGLTLTKEIDWSASMVDGLGHVTIRVMSFAETVKAIKGAIPTTVPPAQPMIIEWAQSPHIPLLCIVRDKSDTVDRWLVDSIIEDTPPVGSTMN